MITVQEMRNLENFAVEEGVSKLQLMENAGKEVFRTITENYELDGKQVVVFAGAGNNGGDGFVTARYFFEELQLPVLILFFGHQGSLTEEAEINYNKIKDKIPILEIKEKEDLKEFHFQKDVKFILLDALLGTGVKGELRELISSAIDLFNQQEGIKVALDLPSGLDPNTGEVQDKICEVDLIITFHDLKRGLEKLQDKTVIVDIGIPKR